MAMNSRPPISLALRSDLIWNRIGGLLATRPPQGLTPSAPPASGLRHVLLQSHTRRHKSRITNGKRFDPRKVKPGGSAARRYADIQAELLQAAGPDISPQLKMMVPHIAILKMTIEEQENLLAAREPGFDPDDYGVMVDRLYLTASCDAAFVSLASNRTNKLRT